MTHAQRARIAMERNQGVLIFVKGTQIIIQGRIIEVNKEAKEEILKIAVSDIGLTNAKKETCDVENPIAYVYASDVAVFILRSD